MADTTVSAIPQFITSPYIQIGTTGSAVIFGTVASHVSLTPDQDENTVETFGGVYTSYKAEKWILEASIPMSYTTSTGAWTALRAMANTTQAFEIRPSSTTVGVSNPRAYGTVYVKGFSFIDAGPGEASEVDLVFACQGVPTFADNMSVEVDTSRLERDVVQLTQGLDRVARDVPRRHAEQTARELASKVPVRTGALRRTISSVMVAGGFGVTYGAGLRYAWPVEARTHAVNDTLGDAPRRYRDAVETATAAEVNRI